MSFDIARTPTVEAVATQDEQRLAQDLQERVEESIRAAETEAAEAIESHRAAEERLAKLKKAERGLSQFAKELREQAAVANRGVLDAIIEAAAAGEKP